MKNLLILCGGQSPEHEISIRSTKNILEAIDKSKYSITIIGISQQGSWRLVEQAELGDSIASQGKPVTIQPGDDQCFMSEGVLLEKFDVVFPVLHGPNGEDGTIQGLLKLLGLPYIGPDLLSSAAAMDKDVTKRLLRDADIKVAKWMLLTQGSPIPDYAEVKNELGAVVFVKPANMGSSVGVHRVASESEWDVAVKDAFAYDRKVLVEQQIKGRELECAVLGNENPKATGVGEVQSGDFYSYEEKYASSSEAKVVIPANIDDKYIPLLRETAIKAYQSLGCQGLSRVDMFLTDTGEIYVNEINTLPGFTNISMYPKLWEASGIGYSELIDELIELGIARG